MSCERLVKDRAMARQHVSGKSVSAAVRAQQQEAAASSVLGTEALDVFTVRTPARTRSVRRKLMQTTPYVPAQVLHSSGCHVSL
jgi:hypothetical protein